MQELHPANNVIGFDNKDVDRFLSKIAHNEATDCWLWIGALDHAGYGHFSVNMVPLPAHRASYLLSIGPIPIGRQVHHKCNVRNCVNPNHMEVLTPAEHVNVTVGHGKNKTHCKRGHEFTEENTRHSKSGRICNRCRWIRIKERIGIVDVKVDGPFSKLYCKHGHPLFGDNVSVRALPSGETRRICRQCATANTKRYVAANHELVIAEKRIAHEKERQERTRRRAEKLNATMQKMIESGEWKDTANLILSIKRSML